MIAGRQQVAANVRALETTEWVLAVARGQIAETARNPVHRAQQPAQVASGPDRAPAVSASSSCGGDLPPCYVCQRESHCTYGAFNPTGCGGSGCFGKWQASKEWACHFGLPCDIAHWTPAQQDQFARALWNGGKGCSNWSACG